jgi:hypothetical protein
VASGVALVTEVNRVSPSRAAQLLDGTRTYIVYDPRAASGDTFEATVYEAFDAASDGKAKREAYRMWGDRAYVLYGYTFKDGKAVEDDAPLKKH